MAHQTVETEQRRVDIVNLLLKGKRTIAEIIKRVDGVNNSPQCYNLLTKLEDGGYLTRNEKKYGVDLWEGVKVYTAIKINRAADSIHNDILSSILNSNHTTADIKIDIGHCESMIREALRELVSSKEVNCKIEGRTNFYTLPHVRPKKQMPASKVSNAWAIPAVNL